MHDALSRGSSRPESGSSDAPIAVIGIGCRFPGGVDSADALWRVLAEGRDLVTEVPPDRWDVDAVYDPEPGVPGKVASRWGGFVSDITGFEPEFFGLTEHEAERMDPQSRMLLETACEALEHAGLPPHGLSGVSAGVFAGHANDDYLQLMNLDEPGLWDPHSVLGTAHASATGRISYLLGLCGPAITLDTGCSSALVAVHLACRSLNSGEVDLALAGGVALALTPQRTFTSATLGMLSTGRECRAFGAGADGTVRGEGCGMVALKRLPDAIEAGDRVLAVLRGTGVGGNGRSPDTMTGSSKEGQYLLQQEVLARSGVDPARVGLVETHGAGIPAGDLVEYAALRDSYGAGDEGCALGAIKTNLGHTDAASGIAGLIKAVMAVRHGSVPANLHFTGWHPDIEAEGGRLFVPTELTPWPVGGGPRLAAVSSHGYSGTNAHVIVEEAPAPVEAPEAGATGGVLRLYPISAGSPEALASAAGRVAHWLVAEGADVPLTDVGYTLAHRREYRTHRAAVLAGTRAELADRLRLLAERQPDVPTWVGTAVRRDKGPVWVFSGAGSEWPGMGRALLRAEPAFAETVDLLEPVIAAGSGFSLREALESGDPVTGAERVGPVVFAMHVGLAAAWRARGVEPAAVIGTSAGEIAAAVVAGALSLADGAAVVCHRSTLLGQVHGPGAVACVGLPSGQVAAQLSAAGVEDVGVAAVTCPSKTVISGAAGRVHALVSAWQANDVETTVYPVDVATHSAQVDEVLPGLRMGPADLTPREPDVPMYGTVLEDPRATPSFDAAYWADNARLQVRFAAACSAALADGHRTFIEVSPHPLLTDAIQENAAQAGRDATVLPTLVRGRDQYSGLAAQAAAAYCVGVPLSWREHSAGRLADVPLPPWAGRPLWLPDYLRRKDRETDRGRPLLGVHVCLPDTPDEDVWQADVGTDSWPWLRDHQVHGLPAMPASGYAEMALAVAADLFGEATPCEVRDLTLRAVVFLERHTVLTTRSVRRSADSVSVEFLIDGEGRAPCVATAVVCSLAAEPRAANVDLTAALGGRPPAADPAGVYEAFWRRCIQHGPNFTALGAIHLPGGGKDTVLARVALPPGLRAGAVGFRAHPVLLDACVQAISAHPGIAGQEATLLPQRIGAVRRLGDPNHATWCEVRLHEAGEHGVRAGARLLTGDGRVVAELEDVHLGVSASDSFAARADHRMLAVRWDEAPHPGLPAPTEGSWLVLAEQDDQVADALAGALGSALLAAPLSYAETGVEAVSRHLTDHHTRIVMLCPAPAAGAGADSVERARDRVRRLTGLIRTLADAGNGPRLYVVTRGACTAPGTDVPNLEQAPLRAVCRVAGTEHPGLRVTHVDVDADGGDPADLSGELLADSAEDDVAWRGGRRYVARLRRAPLHDDERRMTIVRHGQEGLVPAVRHPGDLGSFELRTSVRRDPGPGEIEIRVHAAGLTFRDVLGALGRRPAGAPGLDCAGEVVAVGEDVTGLRPGDRVAAFTPGAMASFVTVPEAQVFTIPPALSYEEAATIPAAYLLAAHAVRHLARVRPGERVLVHSATGGVGMAVIALARAAGARVHATAGSVGRRDLLRNLGVDYVYDSRTLEFAEQLLSVTDGEGVDVVINPFEGPALRAGLDLLRPGGRFIHIGGSGGSLGPAAFERNVIFAGVDLASAPLPGVAALVREIGQDVAAGRVQPLPHTAHDIEHAGEAFSAVAAREHTGKLVIVFPQEGTTPAIVPPDQVPVVRPDGAYIITGGLGVHGLLLAHHLAESGAGRIVLSGRSRPAGLSGKTVTALRRTGADIQMVRGDLADPATAAELVATATATGLPLRGIAHAAGAVEEADLTVIDDDLLDRIWGPKALGAWSLLQTVGGAPLDWWLSFSSAASLIGGPGKGASAAANGWLDAFTAYCRSQGVPAQSVNWGRWDGQHSDTGSSVITADEGLAAVDLLLRYDRERSGYLPFEEAQELIGDRAQTTPFFTSLAGHLLPSRGGGGGGGGGDTLRIDLRAADAGTRHIRITEYIVERSSDILRCDRAALDPDSPLSDSGLDSLMALRLRIGIERDLGIRVAAETVWDHPTPAALAAHLADRL